MKQERSITAVGVGFETLGGDPLQRISSCPFAADEGPISHSNMWCATGLLQDPGHPVETAAETGNCGVTT